MPGGAASLKVDGPDGNAVPGFRLARHSSHFELIDSAARTVGPAKFSTSKHAAEHRRDLIGAAGIGPLRVARITERTFRSLRVVRSITAKPSRRIGVLRAQVAQ